MQYRIPRVLTQKEACALMLSWDRPDKVLASRDRCLLELGYGCGLRVSELIGLRVNQLGAETLRVVGKGDKERIVPIGRNAPKRPRLLPQAVPLIASSKRYGLVWIPFLSPCSDCT